MVKVIKKNLNSKSDTVKKVINARKEMAEYMAANKLKTDKDYSKHPKHGPVIKRLQAVINLGSEKATEVLAEKNAANRKAKKPDAHPKVQDPKQASNTYTYPEVEGKPLTPDQKKKFRSNMRSLIKSGMDVTAASKLSLQRIFSPGKRSETKSPKTDQAKSTKLVAKGKVEQEKPVKKTIKKVKKASQED